MALSRSLYELRRFTKSTQPDFGAAMILYAQNMPDTLRTNTNEIASWLDDPPPAFAGKFYTFGFYRNKKLIGFSEVSYFDASRIFVCDYIVIDKPQRTNGAFSEFVDQLRTYLEALHPQYRYAIAEVGYGNEPQPPPESRLLQRLLKNHEFRIVRASYFQPRLALDHSESEMRAHILILSNNASATQIKSETYLHIVHTIYYNYYLPWYSTSPEVAKGYRKHLDRLYAQIKSEIKRKQFVPINGHNRVLEAPENKETRGAERSLVKFTTQSFIVVISTTGALAVMRSALHLSDGFTFELFGAVILSFLAIASIVSKDARFAFTHVMAFARTFSGRSTTGLTPIEGATEQIETYDQDER